MNNRTVKYTPTAAERDKLYAAVRTMSTSFAWDRTPQGALYWDEVCRNLKAIIKPEPEGDCDLSFLSRGQKERLKKLLSQ